jgi:hypothetical protein
VVRTLRLDRNGHQWFDEIYPHVAVYELFSVRFGFVLDRWASVLRSILFSARWHLHGRRRPHWRSISHPKIVTPFPPRQSLNCKTVLQPSHPNDPDMRRLGNRKTGKRATSQDVIAFVAQVSKDLHRAPSLNEIARHLGISKSQADRIVRDLIRQGVLERRAAPLTRAKGVPGIRIRATAARVMLCTDERLRPGPYGAAVTGKAVTRHAKPP